MDESMVCDDITQFSTAELIDELNKRNVEWLKLSQHEKLIFDLVFDKTPCKILVVRE